MTVEMELNKLLEEVEELKQTIEKKDIDNIVEEIADCQLVLDNLTSVLLEKYPFVVEEIMTMKEYKRVRTHRRLRNGYYEKV